MFIRKKKYPSGNIGIIVIEKINCKMNEFSSIGIVRNQDEIDSLIKKGRKWIGSECERRHPQLDLFGEECDKCEAELLSAEQMLSYITNLSINIGVARHCRYSFSVTRDIAVYPETLPHGSSTCTPISSGAG